MPGPNRSCSIDTYRAVYANSVVLHRRPESQERPFSRD